MEAHEPARSQQQPSDPTLCGDFAAGLRMSPAAAFARGDFATGMRSEDVRSRPAARRDARVPVARRVRGRTEPAA